MVYEFTFNQPNREFDSYAVNFKAPEALRKAGVTVAFGMGSSSMDAALAKNLPYLAAQAVAFGLPENDALKSITLYPAQLLGVDKRLGSIEPGKKRRSLSATATFWTSAPTSRGSGLPAKK